MATARDEYAISGDVEGPARFATPEFASAAVAILVGLGSGKKAAAAGNVACTRAGGESGGEECR